MNNIEKYDCEFIKDYKEPKEKYVVVSFSIFYIDKYIRHTRKNTVDKSVTRQLEFLYNLTNNINLMTLGVIPKNWYFRIYYDDSLMKFKHNDVFLWKEFFNKNKNNYRLQFVKYKCPKFINSNNNHINLFGTILRLHPLFCKNENTSMVIMFDADNTFTQKYIDEIMKFKESKYDYNTFSSKYEISLYMMDYANMKNEYYFRMGMFSSKVKFDKKNWHNLLYQLVNYEENYFKEMLLFLYNIHKEVRPNREIKKYNEFEYGMDEIILNYQIKKLFNDNNYKLKIVRYKPMPLMIFNTFEIFMKYNYKSSKNDVIKILTDLSTSILKKNKINTNNLDSLYNKLNKKIYSYISFQKFNFKYFDNNFIKPVKKNINLIEKMIMPNNVINFFKNCKEEDFKAPDFDKFFLSLSPPNYLC